MIHSLRYIMWTLYVALYIEVSAMWLRPATDHTRRAVYSTEYYRYSYILARRLRRAKKKALEGDIGAAGRAAQGGDRQTDLPQHTHQTE